MWRVPSERIQLDLGGPLVEVERLNSWSVQYEGIRLLGAFMAATKPEDEYRLLNALYEHFIAESQPQWDIIDHLGAVPSTARGMARLPLDITLAMLSLWLDSLPVAEKPQEAAEAPAASKSESASAVDAVIPPGPANLEVKRRLRAARKVA